MDRTHVAYHEAGHAVAACVLHRGFKRASIVPNDTSSGRVHLHPHPPSLIRAIEAGPITLRVRDMVERQVIVDLSGIAASARSGQATSEDDGGMADRSQAISLLTHLSTSDDEVEAYAEWLYQKARSRIEIWWNAVDAVASALLEKDRLTSREVRHLVHEAVIAVDEAD